MSRESDFHALLKRITTDPASRFLNDDAAVLEVGGRHLVLTKDMIVEGVHYRPDDPPADVAWKLVAVNLSDLAAKAARPAGVLLGFPLGDAEWDRAFAEGLGEACKALGAPLLGGDTVSLPTGAPRILSLTAIGLSEREPPARYGAHGNDELWVSGTIGDGGAGLAMLNGEVATDPALVERYRRPIPRLALGQALGPLVHAMMDVSDGLLIDAQRLCKASARGFYLELEDVPLSPGFVAAFGDDRPARLRAATAGDDYELLFTAPKDRDPAIRAAAEAAGTPVTRIGWANGWTGLDLRWHAASIPLPDRLGYEHH